LKQLNLSIGANWRRPHVSEYDNNYESFILEIEYFNHKIKPFTNIQGNIFEDLKEYLRTSNITQLKNSGMIEREINIEIEKREKAVQKNIFNMNIRKTQEII